MRQLLQETLDTLGELANHRAFEDDAPEFNEGGIGYEACRKLREMLHTLTVPVEDERSFVFTVAIRGVGETEEEALTDAIEAVNDQGGIHPDSVLEAREE